jgi:hypothetical protein
VSREAATAKCAHLAVTASRLNWFNYNVTHGLRRGLYATAASRLIQKKVGNDKART